MLPKLNAKNFFTLVASLDGFFATEAGDHQWHPYLRAILGKVAWAIAPTKEIA